jgi:hypothetical protein
MRRKKEEITLTKSGTYFWVCTEISVVFFSLSSLPLGSSLPFCGLVSLGAPHNQPHQSSVHTRVVLSRCPIRKMFTSSLSLLSRRALTTAAQRTASLSALRQTLAPQAALYSTKPTETSASSKPVTFEVYRWSENQNGSQEAPTTQLYTIDTNECGPMMLDALLKIKVTNQPTTTTHHPPSILLCDVYVCLETLLAVSTVPPRFCVRSRVEVIPVCLLFCLLFCLL